LKGEIEKKMFFKKWSKKQLKSTCVNFQNLWLNKKKSRDEIYKKKMIQNKINIRTKMGSNLTWKKLKSNNRDEIKKNFNRWNDLKNQKQEDQN
jgi:hypothetical protein